MKLIATEHDEQVALFQWIALEQRDTPELGLLFAIPNAGGYRGGYKKNVVRVVNMLREGVKSGVPDLFLPVARGGYHGLFVEMKREKGGRLSQHQKEWGEALTAQGYLVVSCPGWDAARHNLIHYLEKKN
jgi:hypothetical protein